MRTSPGNKVMFPELQQALHLLRPQQIARKTQVAPPPINVKPRKQGARKGPLDIIEFLASEGGIRDHQGELKALDVHKKFVPGFGRLVRETGLPLDTARERAAEQGYFDHIYGDRDRASSMSTVADLLRLVDETHRGKRAYTPEGHRERERLDAEKVEGSGDDANQALDASALSELEALGYKAGDPFTDRVLAIMRGQDMDPIDAIEQASMQETEEAGASSIVDEIPFFGGDDEAQPRAPSGGGEEVGASGQPVERPGPQGEAEGVGASPQDAGEGSTLVSEAPNRPGAVQGAGEREPSIEEQAGAAFDAALDEHFPLLPRRRASLRTRSRLSRLAISRRSWTPPAPRRRGGPVRTARSTS
jgi:hypothetical protein